jgi:hypothetical protein
MDKVQDANNLKCGTQWSEYDRNVSIFIIRGMEGKRNKQVKGEAERIRHKIEEYKRRN